MPLPNEVNGYEDVELSIEDGRGNEKDRFAEQYVKNHGNGLFTTVSLGEPSDIGRTGETREVYYFSAATMREGGEVGETVAETPRYDFEDKKEAEEAAIKWMRENPDGVDGAATGNGRRTVQDGFGLTGFGTTETGFGDPFGVSNEDCGCDDKEKDPFGMFW